MSWLFQHFGAIEDSVHRLSRQPFASTLNALVFSIAIALPLAFYCAIDNLTSLSLVRAVKPEISIYLRTGVDEKLVDQIRSRLKKDNRVTSYRFISREEGLENLRDNTNIDDLLDELEENPIPHVFVLTIRDTDSILMDQVSEEVATWNGVKHVKLDTDWAIKLNAISEFIKLILTFIACLLAVALVAVTFNTIRLQILTRREEVEVSQLIGATKAFVRRPFLYFGGILGFLGGFGACILVAVCVLILNFNDSILTILVSPGWQLTGLSFSLITKTLLSSTILGWLGAWLSVAQHLRQ